MCAFVQYEDKEYTPFDLQVAILLVHPQFLIDLYVHIKF